LTKGEFMPVLEFRTELPVAASEALLWLQQPGAQERLSPPWPGAAVPFVRFTHEHRVEDASPGRSVLVERIDYEPPIAGVLLSRRFDRWLRFRGAIAAGDLARHAPHRGQAPLRVAITGASGLVGGQLAAFLAAGGHEVLRFARGRTARAGEIPWSPESGRIDHEALEGLDAVVHLAGASIASGRWTEERTSEILASRVRGTHLLAEAVSVLREPPRVFLSASAIGIYGVRRDEQVDEGAPPGSGFLAEVARAWEEATTPAAEAGIRTVSTRFGMILTSRGGALRRMLLPFELGAGGPIGDGRQGVSWIALDDAIYAIHHLIRDESLRGPVNVVAPGALPQREFARALGRVLHRPAVVPLPAFAVRAIFGRMGEELLLGGQFVEPKALARSGFVWSVGGLADALAR
jgi:uncharacterized protein (TIGR01777 family)